MRSLLKEVLLLLFFSSFLIAGDTASFLSLGLSQDGHYFSFAQYGQQDGSGFPYAELYIVDVTENEFVPGGVFKSLWKDDSDPRTTGTHALLDLAARADSLAKELGIDMKQQPRELVRRSKTEREQAEWLAQDGKSFFLRLQQRGDGELGTVNSSAAFQLVLTGLKQKRIIGNFERYRKNVIRYDIDRVLASNDGKSIIIVIRMTKIGFEGPDVRYMVETYRTDLH